MQRAGRRLGQYRRVDGRPSLASRRTRRGLAAALAIAVNVALLSLLAAPGRYRLTVPPEGGARPVDVSVVPLLLPRSRTPASPPSQATAAPAAAATSASASPLAAISPPAQSAPPAAEGQSVAPDAQAVGAALRRSLLGCANPGAVWMSGADRDACRQRLAAGAVNVPHLQGMAPEKLAYYDALAKAQQDWLSGRDPGSLPYIYCGIKFGQGRASDTVAPPHALKFGPCFLEPPRGSLSATLDVPPPDHLSPDAVGPIAGQNPILHQGQ